MNKIVEGVGAWYRPACVPPGATPPRPGNYILGAQKLRAHLDARKGAVAIADGYRKARAPLRAKSASLASPLSIKSASTFRAREAGTRVFKMRFSRHGMSLERNAG